MSNNGLIPNRIDFAATPVWPNCLDPNDPILLAIEETAKCRNIELLRTELAHDLMQIPAFVEELIIETERMLGQGNERTTARYKIEFAKFKEFCAVDGLPSLPTLPQVIAHYIIARISEGASPRALETAVSAIRFIHLRHDQSGHRRTEHSCNFDDPNIWSALSWARKVWAEVKQKGHDDGIQS